MFTPAHKDLLAALACQHAKDVRHALNLANASFEKGHPTIARLTAELALAEETIREIDSERSRRAA